ncbi:OB-fold domain-containing protein [Prescottella agglutinans]|uniref:Hydroxymethylglutaryl-CoA synthase n=1 Tax=Prescottella agglutinans TaxID=1644129 RepID=A0ABT6MEB8_9NOCA|nr:OB-fold domain-containing protein [Prescottella agglutinans]MDH6282657.1 hydroxymethylglutaryl-CoA synthase [Prescottella agglutinans]
MSAPRFGIVSYAAYLPKYRLARTEIAAALNTSAGRGDRVVASFDEDSTTLGVEAARAALAHAGAGLGASGSLHFATTTPAYADKANATAMHAALGLPETVFAADLAGSARSGFAALRVTAETGGLAVLADVIVGRPGSSDESGGGDGAAAFVFGSAEDAVADVLATASFTEEFLDRWRAPGSAAGERWEERFGLEKYTPLVERAVAHALDDAGIDRCDHVVVVSGNPAVSKRAATLVPAGRSASGSLIGYAGTATAGVALADALDRAQPGETILLVSAADGADAIVLRATAKIASRRQAIPVAEQLATGRAVTYPTYLSWRGLLDREPPRRPEPDRVSGPAASRSLAWKFSLTGSRCRNCGFTHLPPSRVCKSCAATDHMVAEPLADRTGTVATYTVDRLAFSPAPPVVDAVVDFDDGGRYTFEVADADPAELAVGTRVQAVFRRLSTAGGVHNYFWKVRVQ